MPTTARRARTPGRECCDDPSTRIARRCRPSPPMDCPARARPPRSGAAPCRDCRRPPAPARIFCRSPDVRIDQPIGRESDAVGEMAVAVDLRRLAPDDLEPRHPRCAVTQHQRAVAKRGAAATFARLDDSSDRRGGCRQSRGGRRRRPARPAPRRERRNTADRRPLPVATVDQPQFAFLFGDQRHLRHRHAAPGQERHRPRRREFGDRGP